MAVRLSPETWVISHESVVYENQYIAAIVLDECGIHKSGYNRNFHKIIITNTSDKWKVYIYEDGSIGKTEFMKFWGPWQSRSILSWAGDIKWNCYMQTCIEINWSYVSNQYGYNQISGFLCIYHVNAILLQQQDNNSTSSPPLTQCQKGYFETSYEWGLSPVNERKHECAKTKFSKWCQNHSHSIPPNDAI